MNHNGSDFMLNSLPRFFSGINGTVVVVGVKWLFALFFSVGTALLFFQLSAKIQYYFQLKNKCAVERWQKTTQKV